MDAESRDAEMAKVLNLPEGEILDFIRESMKAERNERVKQREHEKKAKPEEEERKERMRIEQQRKE